MINNTLILNDSTHTILDELNRPKAQEKMECLTGLQI